MGNERMATAALLALHEMSLRVPDDVSLVGYDDQPDLADNLHPRLTTVVLPHYEMGRAAGRIITSPEDPDLSGPLMVDCPLVERDSVGPPREN
ncbi:substrate-binding family protein [Kribbella sp. VKM Ac-2527]|uniref:Substrate-binding family protein n=2 Tax=Kribbella caucasensis TaxID=2512215 RepID=A0A4R6KAQ7_9ACTN|nr:substrate-binding family protein [Kribbella sp. VKM Ac-2527]